LTAILEALRATGAPKPILTGYLPPYDPSRAHGVGDARTVAD